MTISFNFLCGFNDGSGLILSLSLYFSGEIVKCEVTGDHQHVDRQLQLHPAITEADVCAETERGVAWAMMLIPGRQIPVYVKFCRIREGIVHVVRGRLRNVYPCAYLQFIPFHHTRIHDVSHRHRNNGIEAHALHQEAARDIDGCGANVVARRISVFK